MIKVMLILIVIMWTVALVLPSVLKIIKHRKEKGVVDAEKSKDVSKS